MFHQRTVHRRNHFNLTKKPLGTGKIPFRPNQKHRKSIDRRAFWKPKPFFALSRGIFQLGFSLFIPIFCWGFTFNPQYESLFLSKPNQNIYSPFLGQTLWSQPAVKGITEVFWIYDSIILNGRRQPKPNPDIHISWCFEPPPQMSLMHWQRVTVNQRSTCQRMALWEANDRTLREHVTWTSPNNSRECWSDPDMQIGRTIFTPYHLVQEELLTQAYLGHHELWIVWRKQPIGPLATCLPVDIPEK